MTDKWRYQIVRYIEKGQVYFALAEVYLNENMDFVGWCKSSLAYWESEKELRGTVNMMYKDIHTYPVIKYPEDFTALENK